jgi:hypothetical protein
MQQLQSHIMTKRPPHMGKYWRNSSYIRKLLQLLHTEFPYI